MKKDGDIRRLRIIVFSFVVLSFLFCLLLVKWGAERFGLNKGNYFPLLPSKKSAGVVEVLDSGDVDGLNRAVGKVVWVKGRVDRVEEAGQGTVLVVGNVAVRVPEGLASKLANKGLPVKDMAGMIVKVKGRLRYNSKYGFELTVENSEGFEVLKGKVGR